MTRRILVSYLLITIVVLAMLTVPLGLTFGARERDRLLTSIERDARVLAAEADDAYESGDLRSLPILARQYAEQTGGRVVLVDAEGVSIVDSDDPSGEARDFSTRPEVADALAGNFTTGERRSDTLDTSLSFVAVPVRHEGDVLGAVRVTYPTRTVDARTRQVWLGLVALDALIVAFVAAAGWFVARTLARPVGELERAAEAMGDGHLGARAAVTDAPDDLLRLAATFNTMADRLEQLVESQRSFLADASHQLRTPLTALRLRVDSLTARLGAADEAASDDLAAVMAEVDRLAELVDGLLLMARLDARRGDDVAVDLGAVAAERVTTWAVLAEERSVHLEGPSGAAASIVQVPEGSLEQVLDNLVANALDHAPAGSTVSVDVTEVGSSVRLSVTDHGPGLDEALLARAFDRFWRGPGAAPGGSGLGLAVVRQLAEQAGGRTWASATPGGGLTIWVELPLAAGSAPPAG